MNEVSGVRGPRYCVLEATLACNAKCRHCGSRAGRPRERELDTDEMIGLVRDLGALGTKSVTLSGGEPLLRPDWVEIAAAIRDADMRLEMITNGLVVEEQAEAIARAGFFAVTFSVDGPAAIHDELRGVSGGLDRLLRGAGRIKELGVRIGACTQINRLNLGALEELHGLLVARGFDGWQLQLTMPIGLAAERRDELCIAPSDLPEVERKVLSYEADGAMFCHPADNIGYMSRNEPRLRSGSGRSHQVWMGCRAGIDVIGVTSDGTVRGCLSLPADFDEGNVRERPLAAIWSDPGAFSWNRGRPDKKLEGSCAACPFGKVCRAGCTCLAFSATGGTNWNPYCLFALESQSRGPGDPVD
jgi:radical SAM protein with 4Fe4S-binding SPASM domain